MRAQLPANTNVLYADLAAVRGVVQGCGAAQGGDAPTSSRGSASGSSEGALGQAQEVQEAQEGEARDRSNEVSGGGLASLPGMILNLKKPINYCCHLGLMHRCAGGSR